MKDKTSRNAVPSLAVLITIFTTLSSLFTSLHCFSTQDLMNKHYPKLISNDIYMDPCKSGKV